MNKSGIPDSFTSRAARLEKREWRDLQLEEIRSLLAQGLSQQEIADRLHISQATVSRRMAELGIKGRRNAWESKGLDAALIQIVEENAPCTVRQVFYRAVVAGLVEKSEKGYDNVAGRLVKLRDEEEREFPIDAIVDGGRRIRSIYAVDSMEEELRNIASAYRRRVWSNQDAFPVVVIEKLALVGVIEPITDEWDVPLVPVQGFSSISLIWDLAQLLADRAGKHTPIYYFGDYDPSGTLIDPAFERRLLRYYEEDFGGDPDDIVFRRVSILADQIEEWNLPTRPTKRVSASGKVNSHALGFADDRSVELDALPSADLRQLVRDSIEENVDEHAFRVLRVAEESERSMLTMFSQKDPAARRAWLTDSADYGWLTTYETPAEAEAS